MELVIGGDLSDVFELQCIERQAPLDRTGLIHFRKFLDLANPRQGYERSPGSVTPKDQEMSPCS